MEKEKKTNLNNINKVYEEINIAESLIDTIQQIENENKIPVKKILINDINKMVGKSAFIINGHKIIENTVIKDIHKFLNKQVGIKSQHNALVRQLKRKLELAKQGYNSLLEQYEQMKT